MSRSVRLVVIAAIAAISPAAAFASGTITFHDALNDALVRPRTVELAADGGLYLYRLHWSAWGGNAAVGSGWAHYRNGCIPNCAEAKTYEAPVRVRFSNVRRCPDGSREYTHVALNKRNGQPLEPAYLRISWEDCQS